jgi:protoheme IX farnesyltransferase
VYTPLKRKSPIAVFVGAIPGALPPLIGYFAAFENPHISWIPIILFLIQFVWQFPHFWAIAWVLDDDYKRAGFRLLPTTQKDKKSALWIVLSTLILIPVSIMPLLYHFAGYSYTIVAVVCGLLFLRQAYKLYQTEDVPAAKKLMYSSFLYLPIVQLMLLFDFITV